MLRYTAYNLIFLLLAIPLSVVLWNNSYGWLFALLFIFLFLAGHVSGSANVCSGFYLNIICKGDSSANAISLSFDDGPCSGQTEKILEILKKNNVKATFFCIGNNVQNNPGLIKIIINEGHIVGNHSFSHGFWFDLLSKSKMKEEIIKTNKLISDITGNKMKFFRPPYGVTTPVLARAVKETNMLAVGWSVRTFDTAAKGDIKKIEKKLNKVKSGDIILFHDRVQCLPQVLEDFIVKMKSESINIIPLNELIKINAYE